MIYMIMLVLAYDIKLPWGSLYAVTSEIPYKKTYTNTYMQVYVQLDYILAIGLLPLTQLATAVVIKTTKAVFQVPLRIEAIFQKIESH